MKNLKDFIGKIICDNCINVLPKIPDKSIDLILTDPPYQLDWRKVKQIELHGRKAFMHNFNEFKDFDNIDIKTLYEIMFSEFDRLLKETGSVLIFARNELVTWAIDAAKKNHFDIKCIIFWHKTNPPPQIRKANYLSSVESIIWLARWHPKKMLFTFNFETQKEMHNFVEMPICGGDERTPHPTQKPLKLIEHLVNIHSNENDLILDPFLGSGTTAVAARFLKRRFIGIEKEEKYCEMARQRLAQGSLNI